MMHLTDEQRAAVRELTVEARCENCGAISLTRRAFGCHRCGHWPEGPPADEQRWVDALLPNIAKQRAEQIVGCSSPHCWAALTLALLSFGLTLACLACLAVLLGR